MNRKITFAAFFVSAIGFASCSDTGERIEDAETVNEMATEDTAVMYDESRAAGRLHTETPVDIDEIGVWDVTSFEKEPVIDEPELRDSGVEMRGNDKRNVYAVEQDIMFETDKAKIRPEGEEKLQKIAKTIKKRAEMDKVQIYVFGHTDARASKAYNKELGRERAQSVADWLGSKGDMPKDRIEIKSMGETAPEATNETAAGRQQNRRVEIVVNNK